MGTTRPLRRRRARRGGPSRSLPRPVLPPHTVISPCVVAQRFHPLTGFEAVLEPRSRFRECSALTGPLENSGPVVMFWTGGSRDRPLDCASTPRDISFLGGVARGGLGPDFAAGHHQDRRLNRPTPGSRQK